MAKKEYKILVYDGEIVGYDGGSLAFRISRNDDGTYTAEDYFAGWISPKLDITGAWNLAKEVGITKKEFERAFGGFVDYMQLDAYDFVKWFFTRGQIPENVKIDDGISGLLYSVIESIEEMEISYISDRSYEEGIKWDKKTAEDVVYDFYSRYGVYSILDKLSHKEILKEILEPVFEDYIEVDKRRNKVTIPSIEAFMEYAKQYDSAEKLYNVLHDYIIEKLPFSSEQIFKEYKKRILKKR